MIDVSVNIDQAALAKLDGLLTHIGSVIPGRLPAEVRRAGVYICKSLRARTKVAPKRARPSEYRAERSYDVAPYLTLKGRRNPYGTDLNRRWKFTKLPGTPDAISWIKYPYTARHLGPRGRMTGGSRSAEVREILETSGLLPITRRGLAKKSWGWIANGIYNGASSGDLTWRRRRRERRDPRDYVRGVFQKLAGGAAVDISNRLDYALDALKPGALAEAINAAASRLEHNVAREIIMAENVPHAWSAKPRLRMGRRSAYQNWVADTKGWL